MANPANEPSPETRDQRIADFLEATCGTSEDVAIKYLTRHDWDYALAVTNFWAKRSPPHSRNTLNFNPPLRIGQSNSKDDRTTASQGFSDSEIPPGFGPEKLSSSPMEVGEEQQSLLNLIPDAIPLMESSQVKKEDTTEEEALSLTMDVWIDLICFDTGVSREEALFYLEGFKWKFSAAKEACRNKTLPPVDETPVSEESTEAATPMVSNQRPIWNQRPISPMVSNQLPSRQEQKQPSRGNDELIKQFLDVTGETNLKDALYCLEHTNWNLQNAADYYFKKRESLLAEESDAQLSQAIKMSLMEDNRGLPHSSTETGRSSEGNVTVAVPGTASSQVKESTELFDVPIGTEAGRIVRPRAGRIVTATELPVRLADGSKITVGSGQTVRDIRNAVEDITPHDNKDYHFECIHSGKAYTDLDTTVYEILSDGATELIQVTPLR